MASSIETNIPFEAPATRGLTGVEFFALVVVVAAFAAKTWVAVSVGLDGDEAYYAMWSAWLSPGYLDHPPGIALQIGAGRALAGDSLLGVRLLPLLSGVVVALALYRLGRLLVPGRTVAALAVAWYALSGQGGIAFVATPDAPSTLFWVLSLWAAAEAVVRVRPNWWLAVGIFAGLGLVSKYTNAWLGVGLVAYLLLSAEGRAQLARWQLWAGGALAALVFMPVLIWNQQHGWASFLFQGARITTFKAGWGELVLEFLVGQAAIMGPVLFVGGLLGIAGYFFGLGRREGARLALPALTTLPLLAYFLFHSLHSRVETNWTHPITPVMALLAVAFFWLIASQARRERVAGIATAVHAVLGVATLAFVYVQAVYYPIDMGIADRTRMLRGWDTLAAEVRGLADAEGAQAIWTEWDYRLTGELFFHGLEVDDPRPVRDLATGQRYSFIPAAERYPRTLPALLVRRVASPDAAVNLTQRPEFETARLLKVLRREEGPEGDRNIMRSLPFPGFPTPFRKPTERLLAHRASVPGRGRPSP